MKIAIVSGSHRENSESERTARFVEKELKALGITTYLLSLAKNPLPLWDEGVWNDDPKWKTVWGPIADEIRSSDGLVVISPEWSGMVPPGLKNFFLLCGTTELGHKPGLLMAVSSGVGGSYPINELRTSSYKNSRFCYIPDHVIIRDVNNMLKGDAPASDRDAGIRQRIQYSLKILLEYSKALKGVRESGVPDFKEYPHGM